jgi:hypothetical protein
MKVSIGPRVVSDKAVGAMCFRFRVDDPLFSKRLGVLKIQVFTSLGTKTIGKPDIRQSAKKGIGMVLFEQVLGGARRDVNV